MKLIINCKDIKEKNKIKIFSEYSFYFGIFLLPSAFSLALIFLLFSVSYGFFTTKDKFFTNKFNITFLIISLLMILSALVNTFDFYGKNYPEWNKSLAWIGLTNWLPMFFCFWGSQIYLNSESKRRKCALFLIAGTFPVLASGIAQSFFGIYGPFKTLNGLIVWYQRPINDFTELSAVFSNRNYAGCWFNIIWPFCLESLIRNKKNLSITTITLPLCVIVLISIILTTSRAAWIGITLTVPLLIGLRSLYWFLPILFLITLLIASCIYPILGSNIQEFLRIYIPQNIWEEFTPLEFINQPMSRIEIWDNAVDSISNNLFFGSGASSFPFYLKGNNYFVHWHAHNLPLDIALSFGLPVMFILITTIFILTFISFKKIYIKNKLNLELLTERAWITSLIIIMMTHLVDIQYFDGRISITSWFLLAGMNCMIRDNSQSITR